MKLKNLIAGVAATVALAGVAVAQPQGAGPMMMGGGHYGMGVGVGGGAMFSQLNDAYAGLDLTTEQQATIAGIQRQASNALWQHLGAMHGQGYHMQGMFGPGLVDVAAARKSFQKMADAHKATFELQLDARIQIDAVLTTDQREKLNQHWSSR